MYNCLFQEARPLFINIKINTNKCSYFRCRHFLTLVQINSKLIYVEKVKKINVTSPLTVHVPPAGGNLTVSLAWTAETPESWRLMKLSRAAGRLPTLTLTFCMLRMFPQSSMYCFRSLS